MGPNLEARASIQHPFGGPTNAKVQAIINFITAKGLLRSKQEVLTIPNSVPALSVLKRGRVTEVTCGVVNDVTLTSLPIPRQ